MPLSINQFAHRQSKSGFTLIETLVALFVLSLGLLAVLMVFPFISKQLNLAEQTTQASFLAQAKIENLISQPYEQVAIGQTNENSLPGNFATFKRLVTITYVDADLNPAQNDTGLKKIVVTVTSASQPTLNYQLVTLITSR
ncbi:MAG: prepilin-type N-terminal cleavage/methylation domain-containing protein [Candidatus Komeilibacteria bacterium]|nr:prepilin-type N-terminal cleavage/methylation domain-containing protein [Candidatus Komeilibacteria bacterium]